MLWYYADLVLNPDIKLTDQDLPQIVDSTKSKSKEKMYSLILFTKINAMWLSEITVYQGYRKQNDTKSVLLFSI